MLRSIHRKLVLLISYLVLVGQLCFAQQQYRFRNYTTSDGLAFEEARSIAQDSLGYIWIQHLDGLTRFDGYEFKVYKYDPDDSARNKLNILLNGNWQDRSGTLFIGGSNRFLKYDPGTDGFISLPPIHVNYVWQDLQFDPDENKIWLCTFQKGLFLVEGKERTITSYFNPHTNPKTELDQNDLNSALDMGSSLLIATLNGLWLFDKNSRKFERPEIATNDTTMLYHSFCISLIKQRDGTIWLQRMIRAKVDQSGRSIPLSNVTGLNSEFIKLDSELRVIKKLPLPEGLMFNSCTVTDDIIWLGNQGEGLFRVDTHDSSVTHIFHDPTDPYSIPSNVVRNIFIDREKNVWIATSKGISVLRYSGLEFNNMKLADGLIDGSQLYQTKDKELLMLSRRSAPVMTPDNANIILMSPIGLGWRNPLQFSQVLTPIKGYAANKFLVGKRNFWVAAPGSGVFGFPIDLSTGAIQPAPVQSIIADPENKNTIGHRLVTDIQEDDEGILWVANKRTGLDRINTTIRYGSEASVTHFKHSESDSNSIQEDRVYSLFPEEKTSMWVLTETGLDLLVKNGPGYEPKFKHILVDRDPPLIMHRTNHGELFLGTTRGLYEVHKKGDTYSFDLVWNKSGVTDVQEDQLGRLWIYGANLLGLLDRKNGIQIEFTKAEGINHTGSYNPGHMHQAQDGTIILVDQDGVSAFDPLALQISDNKIHPVLTNLKVNNHSFSGNRYLGPSDYSITADIQVLNDLRIDYLHNNFTIEFSAMEMTSPERNLYRHKLEGYDQEWIETDWKTRIATYTSLPPGDYTFRVKASNHHGVWSDNERTLKVIILPPPWRTWWAYTGYGLIFVGLLYWARSNLVQRERLKASLQVEQVEREKEHFELEKAKEVDRVKSSFFANISHEFRTPLTLIKGPVQDLLEKYASDPKTQERLKLVQRNSDLLLKLINQLLDLAKLESGSLKVEKSEGDVYSFVRAIASSFSSFAAQKKITVHVDVSAERCKANFDKDKLETILINLINNAIKFTPSGGTVTVTAVLHLDTNVLILQVKDTGIGISEEHQHKIFERFHQVSDAHKEVGTGIGLSLVKELVALMEGTISVKSEVGKGSEFTVILPIEWLNKVDQNFEVKTNGIASHRLPVTGDWQLETNHKQQEGEESKPHILVVEDNNDLRAFIIDSLGDEFYFLEAENGKIGLNIATTEVPDLIVSDVMMPEMDGNTMATKIKNDIRTSHIPLILLTAKSTDDSKLQGLQSGADDYLTKPFNKQELLLKVRNGVNRQLKLRERLRAELMSTAPKVEVLSADEKFLNEVKEGILKRLNDEQLSVESLAEDMGMSRVQLYRKVTGLTGMSVNELIRKLRLQRAAQLLQQKWGPVSQVAYEVGFSNLSYFSKVFKEEFGVLPSEYEPNQHS